MPFRHMQHHFAVDSPGDSDRPGVLQKCNQSRFVQMKQRTGI